jgi:hypothetical protein
VPPEYVADALGIEVKHLKELTEGRVIWTRPHRLRAIAALDNYRAN